MKHATSSPSAAGLPLVALLASALSAQAAVTAKLQPESLRVGESARLAITVQGSQYTEPEVPDVPGLTFTPGGVQSSMSMINGVVSSNVTRFYRVTADRAGNFTIPAITAGSSGSSQPLSLTVTQGSGRPSAAGSRSSQPPPRVQDKGQLPADAQDKLAFLRVVLPKKELTVGELVPVAIKAYIRAGVTVSRNGLPTLNSDAFTLNKLPDRATQVQENINGVPYIVVTWTSSLSAVKAGEYPLNLTMPLIARVRERAARRNPLQDAFGEDLPDAGFDDPIFDRFFGRSTEKDLTMHTDGEVVKISEVPVEGRPADFSGAVGKFGISGSVDPLTGTTGDPLTLKLSITGEGNFNRVSTEGLSAGNNWKTYEPAGSFAARDSSETSGTKTFTQSIVPLKAGLQDVPPVSFSFFDPDSKKFVTKTTAPLKINIRQGAAAPAAAPVQATAAAAPVPEAPKPGADGLMPDQTLPAVASSTLRPLVRTPWFLAVNAAMLAALVLGSAARRLRSRWSTVRELPPHEAAEKAVAESVSAMEAALQARDAPRFFEAARRAVQERLGAQWKIPAARVTLPEIRSRLNGQGGEVRALFETADEIAYSGRRFTTPDLQQWRELVKTQLQQLAKA
ncbi:MAG: BatD family protein [Verrucomicrobiota bacterium]